ncbi:MAG: hypothetical protein ACD_79C00723G0004 [uncultured bacterium]|nr:MAG: hypothetical protein ACD_79C00723G0004 [uncultured bacterium]
MKEFWICFVSLFIAVDAIGVLPLFVSLTHGIKDKRINTIILNSLITSAIVGILFLYGGPSILEFMGITVADFMIAGGLLLLVISLSDLLSGDKKQRQFDPETLGAVPIGVPLITGPAVLTSSILLAKTYGEILTTIALILNVIFAGIIFYYAKGLTSFLGKGGSKAVSKIASLLLATISVMLIRKGIFILINNYIHPGT